ncbi:MAG: hypothetical protein ACLR8Y_17600 [Alistipes indistinctus]
MFYEEIPDYPFVLVGVSSIRAHAQDYNWAIGVRGGVTAYGPEREI